MKPEELRMMIAEGESLRLEFKSDRGPLSDAELIEACVCLANYKGGQILIGVEDNGHVTGLHPKHLTHPNTLAAFVAARTMPPLLAEVEFIQLPEGTVGVLDISVARQPTATSEGKVTIRFLDIHNKPGCRPFYPYELSSWKADRGQADMTAMPVVEATWEDLDPLEFARLRRMVEENRGDYVFLELTDEGIAQALGLVAFDNGKLCPTLAGLLVLGKETSLQKYLTAHEVAFQVLHGSDVKVNEFRRWPLLRAHEWLMQSIQVRNEEQEMMIGSARVGIPRYDLRGLREAINNALIHRDYSHLGATHIQLFDNEAVISNPGGFVLGVTPNNVLVASPHPRNPLLADAFKRIGLVERSGRGVGIIYHSQLQNGRIPPSYDRSTTAMVTITLDTRPADLAFVTYILQTNRQREIALQMSELMALWLAWQESPATITDLSNHLQINSIEAKDLLENLARTGLVNIDQLSYDIAHKESKSREDSWELILKLIDNDGHVTRRSAMQALNISAKQAEYLLKTWVEDGKLDLQGMGRSAHYILKL